MAARRTREQEVLSGQLMDDDTTLSLAELCQHCGVPAESIVTLVEEGVIEPRGHSMIQWTFTYSGVRRAAIALRLQRDLRINLPGVALALDLLDRIEALEARQQYRW